jgi:hypothetical protein
MAVHRFRPALHQAHRKAMKSNGIIMKQTLSTALRLIFTGTWHFGINRCGNASVVAGRIRRKEQQSGPADRS